MKKINYKARIEVPTEAATASDMKTVAEEVLAWHNNSDRFVRSLEWNMANEELYIHAQKTGIETDNIPAEVDNFKQTLQSSSLPWPTDDRHFTIG